MTVFWITQRLFSDTFITSDTFLRHFQIFSDRFVTDIWIWQISDKYLTQFRQFSDRFLWMTVFWQISDRYLTDLWIFWDLHCLRVPEFECTLFSCNLQTPHSHYKVVVFLPACCLCEQQVGRPDNHLRDPFSEVHFNLSDLITVGNGWKVKSPRFECGGGGNILERLSSRMGEEIWKSENHRVFPYWLHKILCKFLSKRLCETIVGSYREPDTGFGNPFWDIMQCLKKVSWIQRQAFSCFRL